MQKNILLVDDETSLRRSLSLSLNQEGYFVEPCENGLNAMKKLDLYQKNNKKFDTIILDVKLPDIDGIKLGKIFKTQYPESKIIFITGYSDDINVREIENITTTAILEKPFSTKELTHQIEDIIREDIQAPAPQAVVKEDKSAQTTFSAYALLKLEEDADILSIYQKLYFDDNVLYCDATNGEYDIFLLVQSHSMIGCREITENVKKINGVKSVDFLEVSNPILEDSLKNLLNTYSIESSDVPKRNFSNAVCSYVLLEVAREKLDTLYPTLYFDDNVVHCDYTDSKYNLVLLVHGTQFSEIDNIVKTRIANLDGVLKTKKFPIITVYEM